MEPPPINERFAPADDEVGETVRADVVAKVLPAAGRDAPDVRFERARAVGDVPDLHGASVAALGKAGGEVRGAGDAGQPEAREGGDEGARGPEHDGLGHAEDEPERGLALLRRGLGALRGTEPYVREPERNFPDPRCRAGQPAGLDVARRVTAKNASPTATPPSTARRSRFDPEDRLAPETPPGVVSRDRRPAVGARTWPAGWVLPCRLTIGRRPRFHRSQPRGRAPKEIRMGELSIRRSYLRR